MSTLFFICVAYVFVVIQQCVVLIIFVIVGKRER